MEKTERLKRLMEIAVEDRPSTKEVTALVTSLIKQVREAMKDAKDGMKSDMVMHMQKCESMCEEAMAGMERCMAMMETGDKKLRDEMFKMLSGECYKLENAIKAIEPYDSKQLEDKWTLVVHEIHAKLDAIKPFILKGEEVRDSLESLPDGKKLEIDAIENLRKELDELKKLKSKVVYAGSGGSSSGGRTVMSYDVSSQLNGVLKTFTIPANWRVISVHSSSFPYSFRPTTDYTYTSSTLVFTSEIDAASTLATGQTITVIYSE